MITLKKFISASTLGAVLFMSGVVSAQDNTDLEEEIGPPTTPETAFDLADTEISSSLYSEFYNTGLAAEGTDTRKNTAIWNGLSLGFGITEDITITPTLAFFVGKEVKEDGQKKKKAFSLERPYLTVSVANFIPNDLGLEFSAYARQYTDDFENEETTRQFSRFNLSVSKGLTRDLSLSFAVQPYYYWGGSFNDDSGEFEDRERVRNFLTARYSASDRLSLIMDTEYSWNQTKSGGSGWKYIAYPTLDYVLTDRLSVTPFLEIDMTDPDTRSTTAYLALTVALL